MHTEFSLDWKVFSIVCGAPQFCSQEHSSSTADMARVLTATHHSIPSRLHMLSPIMQPHPFLKPGAGWRTPEGPCSWPFPAQFHKVNETCRGITAGDGATQALQSITSGVQRHLPPLFAFASRSLVWNRISDFLAFARSPDKDCGWNGQE